MQGNIQWSFIEYGQVVWDEKFVKASIDLINLLTDKDRSQ